MHVHGYIYIYIYICIYIERETETEREKEILIWKIYESSYFPPCISAFAFDYPCISALHTFWKQTLTQSFSYKTIY